MMVYRPAVADDALAIAHLHAKSWQENYRGAFSDRYLDGEALNDRQEVWADRLRDPLEGQVVLVAEYKGKIIGFACAFMDYDPLFGTLLDNLHVSREVQGKGVGRQLMSRVAGICSDQCLKQGLFLWVLQQNEAAHGFYKACGGEEMETVEGCDIGDRPIMKVRYHWPEIKSLVVRSSDKNGVK
ncbi:GNAT family N-acetyltransferase [Zobellia galactanivorans]|nr:GNAT family N-acetyltransferase [Zobellia galactanivorans]